MPTYRNTGARPLAPVSGAAGCCEWSWNPRHSLLRPPLIGPGVARAAGPRPPTRPRGSVPRPRLVRRLREAREAPFVLLVAPAGYGKTTLLSEWAACDGRRFAWIDLGAGDHDPDRLLASVKRTVHDTEPPTVLVVDNAHLVSTPETFDALDDVARSMPSGSQLALASRCEPGLPVGSLRAHRRVFELRTGDLAMTRSEASALLTAAGVRLASDGLDRLMDRTEGWPAGLYLAALSLRAQPSVDVALSRFAGDDQVVADYLRDELMARLEPDHVDFPLRTSILDTLSGSLCDAVLGRRWVSQDPWDARPLERPAGEPGPRRHELPVSPAVQGDAALRAAPARPGARAGATRARERVARRARRSRLRHPPRGRRWKPRALRRAALAPRKLIHRARQK